MNPKQIGFLIFLTLLVALSIAIPLLFIYRTKKRGRDTQRIITDKAILELFEQQPGGLLSVRMLAEKTGLTVGEARSRCSLLAQGGLLRTGLNKHATRYFYELTAPLERIELDLSSEPFLTLEDLQKIFAAYDYKVSPQDLIMATGLPWNILAAEMEHFRKKGVTESVRINRPGDSPVQFILRDPFLKPEDTSQEEKDAFNLELRRVLVEEELIV